MTAVDKISDPDLAAFANADEADTRTVIVEVEVPDSRATVRAPAKKLVRRKTARPPARDSYAVAAGKSMAKFEKLLGDIGLLGDAVRLPSAASFVLDVSPGDLRTLCRSPLVAAIRPNRVHKVMRR